MSHQKRNQGSGGKRAVLIAGPTASGKSALALALAETIGGVIINADSMQVYRDLRIITARPTPDEEMRAPHRLYGHVDAGERFSVGAYLRDARAALDAAWEEGATPIVVGGTGLYFKALTTGLAAVPPVPDNIRAAVQARLAAEGAPALHADLAARDPDGAARLKPNDRIRVARALEVLLATDRPLRTWQGVAEAPPAPDAIKVFLAPDRQTLFERIDARFSRMANEGALEEARTLASRGLDPLLPAMKAHGMPWLIRYLRNEIGLDTAIAGAQQDTRHYAKRQFTWFRHQLPDWLWFPPDRAFKELSSILG